MPRKKKLTHCAARQLLADEGIPFGVNVFTLGISKLGRIAEVAKHAPGSTGRMYYQLLNRLKSC
jgi:hypothetical protein